MMRRRLQLAPPVEWLTTQACAIALLVMVAGVVAGVIGAFALAVARVMP
jgi:hypothetical protein